MVSAFYVGLAALQVGDDVHAESRLSQVTQLVPAEPAGWANWASWPCASETTILQRKDWKRRVTWPRKTIRFIPCWESWRASGGIRRGR